MLNHDATDSYFLEWQMQINTKTYLIFIFINDSLSLKLIFLIFLTPETILQLLNFLIVSYFQMLSRIITRNLSIVQRSILAVGCGVQAVLDPYRYDCVAYSAEASTPPCQPRPPARHPPTCCERNPATTLVLLLQVGGMACSSSSRRPIRGHARRRSWSGRTTSCVQATSATASTTCSRSASTRLRPSSAASASWSC